MNVVDLIERELARFARDTRAYGELRHDVSRRHRGRAFARRVTAYLRAEVKALYPALLAVGVEPRPAMVLHQRWLMERAADARARHATDDDLAHAATLKLQQEMLRYTTCCRRELLAHLSEELNDRELSMLGGEMLLELASNRGETASARLQSRTAMPGWLQSDFGGSGRSTFGSSVLPTLSDVVYLGQPASGVHSAMH
jgi:hypothetical protein